MLLGPGTTYVDVGANIGIFSSVLAAAARQFDAFDVVGMELAVLNGARGLFDAGRIAAVYFDEFADKPSVVDFLAGYGFDLIAPPRLTQFIGRSRSLLAVKRGGIPGTS